MSRTNCGAVCIKSLHEEVELVLSGPTLWNRKTSKLPPQNSFTVFLLPICVARIVYSLTIRCIKAFGVKKKEKRISYS